MKEENIFNGLFKDENTHLNFSSNSLNKMDYVINEGYIYVNVFNSNNSKEMNLKNHEELKKYITNLRYEDHSKVKIYELCEKKKGKIEYSILFPYYALSSVYCHDKKENISYKTAYRSADKWLELSRVIFDKFNGNVLCRSTKRMDTLKIIQEGEECIGYISNSQDLSDYLGKEGMEYFGVAVTQSYFQAMRMTQTGHIIIR